MKICRVMVLGQESGAVQESTVEERFFLFLFSLLEKHGQIEFLLVDGGAFVALIAKLVRCAQRAIGAERVAVMHATPSLGGEPTQAYRDTVDGCDALACFIDRAEGEAYEALLHAQHHDKQVFNFAGHMLHMW